MIQSFDKEKEIVDKVTAARNIKFAEFAEFADYLEGKITFNELMDILILDLDNVDE